MRTHITARLCPLEFGTLFRRQHDLGDKHNSPAQQYILKASSCNHVEEGGVKLPTNCFGATTNGVEVSSIGSSLIEAFEEA